jgi:hypothetical protein
MECNVEAGYRKAPPGRWLTQRMACLISRGSQKAQPVTSTPLD